MTIRQKDTLGDLWRAALSGAAIALAVMMIDKTIVASQLQPATTIRAQAAEAADPETLGKLIAREGSAYTVIVVILFFYRRDWKTAVEFWKDQHALTMELVKDATKAQVDTASALRESTIVTHQLKRVVEGNFPLRRGDDNFGGR